MIQNNWTWNLNWIFYTSPLTVIVANLKNTCKNDSYNFIYRPLKSSCLFSFFREKTAERCFRITNDLKHAMFAYFSRTPFLSFPSKIVSSFIREAKQQTGTSVKENAEVWLPFEPVRWLKTYNESRKQMPTSLTVYESDVTSVCFADDLAGVAVSGKL